MTFSSSRRYSSFRVAILFGLSLTLLFSCTVEKRRHLKGYSVSWHQQVKKAKSIRAEKKIAEEVQYANTNSLQADLSEEIDDPAAFTDKNVLTEGSSSFDNKEESFFKDDYIQKVSTENAIEANAKDKESKSVKGDRTLHPNTGLGIFSAALSIPAVIGMIAAFSGGYLSVILGILLFLAWLFLVIFGYIFSIHSLMETIEHPDEHKGLMWAVLGIALSVISVILFLFFIGLL